ncbi:unnamed protein product [Callosobruchus maculatus]|uniref:Aminoacyl-transfer RNA synthetases class-II family profile domain-containing protein n=1 Tax=Callosobruchus maculatus TaxID=64391 RepID=A0A653CQW8_CALMS|nr:unnamed protein product [Callosobruchus maculatus]
MLGRINPACYSRHCSSYTQSVLSLLKNRAVGDRVNLKGWIKSQRKQKENIFLDLSDGSTDKKLQVVLTKSLWKEGITPGASIYVSGILSQSPRGQLEVHAEDVGVYGECTVTDGYPFAPRKHYPPEYIRQYLHFRPRTNKFASLLRVRSAATVAIYEYFSSKGYTNIHTPVLTSNDCEGAGEVFTAIPENKCLSKSMAKEGVDLDEAFFDTKAFLTVSGQLHLEAAVHGLSKVFCFGPTFRAENSRTRFHLSEFYMLEAEIAFLEKLEHLTGMVEQAVKDLTRMIVDKAEPDINICSGEARSDLSWLDKKFTTVDYDSAAKILNENNDEFKEKFNPMEGFSKEHEMFIVKYFDNVPTFIINWPKEMKPFYMKECSGINSKVFEINNQFVRK